MSEKRDLAPWAHPKSQQWFHSIFERTNFLLSLEDHLVHPRTPLNVNVVRMMLAFCVLLGRDGIWPLKQTRLIKLILEKSREFSRLAPQRIPGKQLTIKEHQAHELQTVEMSREIELIRRRLGISVRKSEIGAPLSWEPFWEGDDALNTTDAPAPWDQADASEWLLEFESWHQMTQLIHGTLKLEAQDHPHGIRAAASLVIMFCRDNLWPVRDHRSNVPVMEIAARQLANVKQLYEMKGRENPKSQSAPAFRNLLVSIDQEIRILEARMTDPKPAIPNQPPCSWGAFWV